MSLRVAAPLASVIALAALVAACGSKSLFGSGSNSNKADDGRRPSEQGEGVVGYLRDPSEVDYRRADGKVVVAAGAGAVVRQVGGVGGMPVCLQQIGADDLKSILGARGKFGGAAVKTLAVGAANADGSFSLSADEAGLDAAKLLSINVTGQCTAAGGESELYASRTSVVFKDVNGTAPFGGGDTLYPEFADAWSESETTEPVEPPKPPLQILCTAKAPECPIPLKLDVAHIETLEPITSYLVTFYDEKCADTKDCAGAELGSLSVNGATIYYPDGTYVFTLQAKGFAEFTGNIQAGKLYGDPILLKPL